MAAFQSSDSHLLSSELGVSTDQQCPPDATGQVCSTTTPDQKLPLPQALEQFMQLEHDSNWSMSEYFQTKRRKLHDQFHDMGQVQSSIFEGVTIYVNGWTQPNADELKRMIHTHGGRYEYNLYSNPKITHTIATNLPNSKVKNLGDSIVCTPDWIVDSIAAGRQLPVLEYRLYDHSSGQKKLKFEAIQPKAMPHPHQKEQSEFLIPLSSADNGTPAGKADESADFNEGCTTIVSFQQPTLSVPIRQDQKLVGSFHHRGTPMIPESVDNYSSIPMVTSSEPVAFNVPKTQTSKGADFVSEFYTHSRLHHLSTWSTELKQFTAKMLQQIHPKYPKLPPGVSIRVRNQRVVVHIDLDCFFVSVSIRNKPYLKGKPVAVAHAKLPKGSTTKQQKQPDSPVHFEAGLQQADMPVDSFPLQSNSNAAADFNKPPHLPKHLMESMSDVASCSYEARNAGVRNGMSVGKALTLCPNLTLLSYEFDSYRQVSQTFYETLLLYSSVVEAVSCDEAYIELTDYVESVAQAEKMVQELRDEVEAKTGCTVSAGISHNMLLARMSTRIAKPNGQYHLPLGEVENFLSSQQVRDLPGVGYSLTHRLQEMGIETCGEVKVLPLKKLQAEFGVKTGQMLYEFARGIDSRELKLSTERKSLSADINFGIRFSDMSEAEALISNLAAEVERRAEEANVLGGTITLKLKIRRPDVPMETRKYLGHGACNNVTRSCTLLQPTQSSSEVSQIAIRLLKQVRPVPSDIRGVGIQLTKLVPLNSESETQTGKSVSKSMGADLRRILKPLTSARSAGRSSGASISSVPPLPKLTTQKLEEGLYSSHNSSHVKRIAQHPEFGAAVGSNQVVAEPGETADESFAIDLPPASQLDSSVLEALPPSMKEKILQSYAKEMSKTVPDVHVATGIEDRKLPMLNIARTNTELSQQTIDEKTFAIPGMTLDVPSREQSNFLGEFREYIRDWVTSFIEGPNRQDLEKVTEYLTNLSRRNLELVVVVLKYFRRLIARLELSMWYPAFNLLLSKLQVEIRRSYGGTLIVSKFE